MKKNEIKNLAAALATATMLFALTGCGTGSEPASISESSTSEAVLTTEAAAFENAESTANAESEAAESTEKAASEAPESTSAAEKAEKAPNSKTSDSKDSDSKATESSDKTEANPISKSTEKAAPSKAAPSSGKTTTAASSSEKPQPSASKSSPAKAEAAKPNASQSAAAAPAPQPAAPSESSSDSGPIPVPGLPGTYYAPDDFDINKANGYFTDPKPNLPPLTQDENGFVHDENGNQVFDENGDPSQVISGTAGPNVSQIELENGHWTTSGDMANATPSEDMPDWDGPVVSPSINPEHVGMTKEEIAHADDPAA